MIRTLYVSDMDGTLLNNGSFLSRRSSDIISDLSHDGALITVATARTPATIVPLMEGTFTTVPYVAMTGATLFDHASMSYHASHIIPPEHYAMLAPMYAEAGVNPFVYHLGDDGEMLVCHDRAMTPEEHDFYEARANLRLKRFTFEHHPGDDRNVILLFAMAPKEVIRPLADAIAATGLFSVSCYPDIFIPGMLLLEVFTAGVSKATAIRHLMQNVGAQRLVAFGDNLNDIPMLDIADVAVAVANAGQQVKNSADIVIGPNYDDAVARFILHDFYNH